MSNIIFDNVFSTEVTKDCINIRFGVCDEEIIKKKKITDSDVRNVKEIHIHPDNFEVFFHSVIAVGVELQKDYGINLGLNLKED